MFAKQEIYTLFDAEYILTVEELGVETGLKEKAEQFLREYAKKEEEEKNDKKHEI